MSMPKPSAAPKLVADPEVEPKRARRSFTAEYKARILAECDAATEDGAIGAILRREGLYSSHLVDWRRQRELGILHGLQPRKRGRKPVPKDPVAEENLRLKRQLERAQEELRRATLIIEAQKKLAEILGFPLPTPPSESGSGE